MFEIFSTSYGFSAKKNRAIASDTVTLIIILIITHSKLPYGT